jgi:hypothetical protein
MIRCSWSDEIGTCNLYIDGTDPDRLALELHKINHILITIVDELRLLRSLKK